ncbi:MAG: anthranilate phosphoribosyltransferase [Kiritimatiellia bacterium]|nr:anthranilate phosphoribosyltransferase [Kiritimatiellia bacterium]
MILETLKKAQLGQHLTADEAYGTFREIMGGEVENPVLIAALLTAMQMNGPTIEEVTGAARAMRGAGVRVAAPADAVDIVGTGGDGFGTFNCSTTAALIAAGAGVTIAKHGNRASTSKSGSADCLAALGYDLNKTLDEVAASIATNGIGFCFANTCHPAMRFAAPIRRALPFRTIFNLLGPLTNPAGVTRHALGVYAPDVMPLYIGALKALGAKKALVFCGPDGLDELGLAAPSQVSELNEDGTVRGYTVDPKDFFGAYAPIAAIVGGTPEENALITRRVLDGEKGAYRNAAVLNAAAAIVAGGKAATIAEGVKLAEAAVDSGAALKKLELLVMIGK